MVGMGAEERVCYVVGGDGERACLYWGWGWGEGVLILGVGMGKGVRAYIGIGEKRVGKGWCIHAGNLELLYTKLYAQIYLGRMSGAESVNEE